MAGVVVLGIRLCFHNHAPKHLAIRLPFQQQAPDELGGDELGGAGEEGVGEGLEILGDGLSGYGSGLKWKMEVRNNRFARLTSGFCEPEI